MPRRALSPKPGPQSPPGVELQFSTAEFHGNRYFCLLEAALLLLLMEPVDMAASHASLQERLSFAGRAENLETTVSPWAWAGVWWVLSLGGAEGLVPATLCPPWSGAQVHFRLSMPLPAGCPGCAEEGVAPCGTLWHPVAPGSHVAVLLRRLRPAQPRGEGHRELLWGQAQPQPPQMPLPFLDSASKMCCVCWGGAVLHLAGCSCLLPC